MFFGLSGAADVVAGVIIPNGVIRKCESDIDRVCCLQVPAMLK
mgnify:FL=1